MAQGRMAERAPARLGKYQILETLGAGGMGVVYLGYDAAIERKVAIKTIRKDVDPNASVEVTARFRREAMAAGRLSHPGIVAVYDYGEDEDVAYIVMEYAPGEELSRHAVTRQLSPPQVAALLVQLLDALHYAHQAGVVHRDIKPANILVSERLKVTDFGIARVSNSTLTQTGAAMGTPAYMAPEQYMGSGVDQRVDLFAAGVILYELLTGVLPFDGDSLEVLSYQICHTEPAPISSRRADLPLGVDALLQRALAKRKEDRFQTAAEFAIAITRVFGLGQAAEAVESRQAFGAAATVAASSLRVSWPPGTLQALEAVLTNSLGSVAAVAVRRSTARATSPEHLVQLLIETLDPVQGSTVAAKLRAVLESERHSAPPATTGVRPVSAPAIVTPEAITRITQALASYVGPIAKVLVKKAHADVTSYEDLCLRLSAKLASEAEKNAFLRTLGVR